MKKHGKFMPLQGNPSLQEHYPRLILPAGRQVASKLGSIGFQIPYANKTCLLSSAFADSSGGEAKGFARE